MLLLLVLTLYGCGAAHVRTDMESTDLHQYENVFISEVRVYSEEDGAGKGSVASVLMVTDSQTGEDKFRAAADSDMTMGAFGGDMEAVLKKNVRALVDQYPRAPDESL